MDRSKAKITIDHQVIREWAEKRRGKPSTVKKTGLAGILRFDFPGYGGRQTLTEVPWDKFFERFEKNKLAFLYQDETSSGRQSRFNKFISRDEIPKGSELIKKQKGGD